MHRSVVAVCGLCWAVLPPQAYADGPPLRDQAAQALRRAREFFRTRVSTEGGYLWRYSEDLSKREGEGKASETTIWVQPPGTPSVGMAWLDAYEATRDRYYLEAARETAYALVRGQLRSGGWDYRIEFDPKHRGQYAYRVDGGEAGARNVTTLDDDTTQSALRFLMRVDRAFDLQDGRIHESAGYALACLAKAQYPNGAWPQRFDSPPDPSRFPPKRASFAAEWSREFPDKKYAGYYTLNDHAIPDMITTMFEAWRIYGDGRYRSSAERAGEFLLLAQMPEPQPAWAQQYDADMHPAWARKFEPPAVTGGESQVVMKTLLALYRETGDRKYLEPLPRAIAYFRRSRLPDGQLARFYELQTNRPLYFTRDYKLTYSDADVPTHYSFKVADQTGSIEKEYERLSKMSPAELKAAPRNHRPRMTTDLEGRVRSVIAALDDQGRWVEEGRLRYHGENDPTKRIIDCQTFAHNVRILSDYLSATSTGVRGAIVLSRASHEWMSQQIEEPCILPNPKVPGRLIMFYGAVSSSNRVVAAIGKAWADTRDPFRWHQDEANPIFRPAKGGWDSSSIRLDTVLYVPEEDAYYIYYSGTTGSVQDRIGLAICPAGADGYSGVTETAIARYGAAPVLAPEAAAPFHETMASQAAVMREWNAAERRWEWYMYYSYRGKDGVLPGIRLATSSDGKSWKRQFNADDPRGMGQIFRSTPNAYYEWHQVFKVDKTYVLCIEVGVDHGARWRPGLAVSTDPVRGWTQLVLDTMLQTNWHGLYDDRTLFHVATPSLYQIEGKWYLFAQACGRPANDNYIDGAWEMWIVACDRVIPTRPGCADLHIPGVPTRSASDTEE